jgi:hypothetical protein
MNEKKSPIEGTEPSQRLKCSGFLGGIRNRNIEITAGKVIASIYSLACCGGKGGDMYYFGVCKNDLITRLAVADVAGHGEAVMEVSQCVYDSLKDHM